MKKHMLTAVMTIAALTGCAAPAKLATPSGRPEVTINSTDTAAIKAAFIGTLLPRGYAVDNEGPYSVTLSKTAEGGGAVLYQALAGNAYSSTPRAQIQAAMTPSNGQTRIFATGAMRMQNAYGRESIDDMTEGQGKNLMMILNETKAAIEGR